MRIKGKFAFLFFAFLVLTTLASVSEARTIYVPDDYMKIQWAVDNASDGDTIIVRDGTYSENIDVNKRLTIKSENGSAKTIVQAANPDDYVFEVTADYVNISGFTAGFGLFGADYCNISDNNVRSLRIENANHNKISKNNISSGILIDGWANLILNNNISVSFCGGGYGGITLFGSYNEIIGNFFFSGSIPGEGVAWKCSASYNVIKDNTFKNCGVIAFNGFPQTVENNTVNGKPLVCLWGSSNSTVENAGQVIIIKCKNVTVRGLNLSYAPVGVELYESENCRIENNTFISNNQNVAIVKSHNNTIANNNMRTEEVNIGLQWLLNVVFTCGSATNNTIINNVIKGDIGIKPYMKSCYNRISMNYIECSCPIYIGPHYPTPSDNEIYLNNFIGTPYIFSKAGANHWNSTKPITYTYNGNTFTNYLGNYWDDYTGSDADSDGIGDIPYVISDDNRDNYPLMQPWENYFKPPTPTPTIIYVPDDYARIQDAVNAASYGDVIIVRDGIYYENVLVTKTLTIRSENGSANCIIDGEGSGDVITLIANRITIEGFTVRNSGSYDAGIKVFSNANNITYNNITNNYYGIYLSSSSNNIIANNTASRNNRYGIYLYYSSNNTIENNTVSSNNYEGIYLFLNSSNNIIANNTVSSNNVHGIDLGYSSNNTIANNTASNNFYGIFLYKSSNNIIYLNNFINNTENVYSSSSTNIWNSTEKITYTYNGNTYTNYLGNYWDDYTGSDANEDGIGDTPYSIEGDADDYPLMQPFENYFQLAPTPPAKILVVNQTDACTTGDLYFSTISDAVMNANDNDTIIVCSGTYKENIVVNKSVKILSYSQNTSDTIVEANNSDDHVFNVTADNVIIKGFTVTGAIGYYYPKAGIYLHKSNNSRIENVNASNNGHGIYLYKSSNNIIANNTVSNNGYGIYLDYSSSNTIANNTASNNEHGIRLYYSSSNIITNNIASSNYEAGIYLEASRNNTIANNTASNNSDGIFLDSSNNIITNNTFLLNGMFVLDSYNNKVTNNTVNGKPLVYLENVSDYVVEDAGQVIVINSKNITVENLNLSYASVGVEFWKTNNSKIINNNISSNNYCGIYLYSSSRNNIANNNISSNNWYGIRLEYSSNNIITNNTALNNYNGIILYYSSNNTITNNTVISNNDDGILLYSSSSNTIANNTLSNNEDGIYLGYSSNNTITNNNVSLNIGNGIYLYSSNNNIIYLNNFINNTDNVYSSSSTNIWNSTEKITYTYNGSQHTNYLGNYWDDYTGSDADGDGIGDTPYIIDGDKDEYPLIEHFEHYFAPDEPKVSVSTDKYEYRAGDVMLINITFENPADESKSVKFLWTLDISDYNLSFKVINNKSLLLPPEFKKTFVISWRLPKWKASFNASWYVALYSDRTISEDTADWRYVGKKGGGRDIAIAEYYHSALDFDAMKIHLEALK